MTTEENYGARPIKRNIQYLIENYLATQILIKNELLQKETTLFYENNELILLTILLVVAVADDPVVT
jgi:ATP-dependent Clp protease ATP-binding subunit ClpA